MQPGDRSFDLTHWKPTIELSPALIEQIRRLVAPYAGRTVTRTRLCRRVQALIAAAHPEHTIEILDKTRNADRALKTVLLGVIVDGIPDQGIVVAAKMPDVSEHLQSARHGAHR